jgi:precorrin-6B C5,15-methyltransferase / cobalt-precorrin-6B C5,C15-methyltransferase
MNANERWLTIVGIGEDGWNGLNTEARLAIESAELLYGGARHLALVPAGASPTSRIAWPSPMTSALQQILTNHRRDKKVTVLASGDPMLYGVGVLLTRNLAAGEFRVVPQVSAFSLACARLGWSMAETDLVSLVNRPIEHLYRFLYPNQRLIVFSEDGGTPLAVARLLTQAGYGPSKVSVFEHLDGPAERMTTEVASDWPNERCGNLNLMAIDCAPTRTCQPLSLVPGLPDETFETDGQMTKREVRAVTLACLAPRPNQLLWDVGAGTGTIGIEWMRANPSCSCLAFEEKAERATRIRPNADRLGVPTLKVIQGSAPASFVGLPQPDEIFMGGSIADDDLFEACWAKLAPGGRLVANAVATDSEARLASRHARHGGELTRLMISRAEPVGGSYGWRPMMPVTQWMVTKP